MFVILKGFTMLLPLPIHSNQELHNQLWGSYTWFIFIKFVRGVLADFYCIIFLKLNNPRKGQTFKVTLSQITRGFGVSLNLSKKQKHKILLSSSIKRANSRIFSDFKRRVDLRILFISCSFNQAHLTTTTLGPNFPDPEKTWERSIKDPRVSVSSQC